MGLSIILYCFEIAYVSLEKALVKKKVCLSCVLKILTMNIKCSLPCNNIEIKNQKPIILFTEFTLEKCHQILSLRKSRKYKFSDFNLPSCVDNISGYHTGCYRRFTAISKIQSKDEPIYESSNADLSEVLQSSNSESTSIGLRETKNASTKNCIFCNRVLKCIKQNKKENVISGHKSTLEHIICNATLLKNDGVYQKLIDCRKNECIRYHKTCLAVFSQKAKNFENSSKILGSRSAHKLAFASVCDFIEDHLLNLKEVHLFEDVDMYEQKLCENEKSLTFSTKWLKDKILSSYQGKIVIKKIKNQTLILDANLEDYQESILSDTFTSIKLQSILRNIAYKVRKEIMEL
ncbi:uncharacterized protein LOC129905221 isoform X2 [Episyrphus balteatus]|uniref:uncharacterized protein LOC129905221 isoform X2 n=1 Tax=Episyrphus balteatus TaxID=286459 RepID=UPI0024858689|nr:uncharacterized protein LOC129905221 isoform X2 [Episyrphus balteatus]